MTDLAPALEALLAPTRGRVRDVLLGGALSSAADRACAAALVQALPEAPAWARHARGFLRRAVQAALAAGHDQFVDLDCGMPSVGDVHQLLARPESGRPVRAALVAPDRFSTEAWRSTLEKRGNRPAAALLTGDVRDVNALLAAVGDTGAVDLGRPVCAVLTGVLDGLGDDDRPGNVLVQLRRALPSGSMLIVSHATAGLVDELGVRGRLDGFAALHEAHGLGPFTPRPVRQVELMLRGWTLLQPGLVPLADWRPEAMHLVDDAGRLAVGAVAVKP